MEIHEGKYNINSIISMQ